LKLPQILRLGVYEILQTDLQPYAVNDHVELAKVCVREQAGGFVNAILRTALRQLDAQTLQLPAVPAEATAPEGRKCAADSHVLT